MDRKNSDAFNPEWRKSLIDPVREEILNTGSSPDLDKILNMFPRLQGEPAFDSEVIKGNIERIKTVPDVNTGLPFLDLSIKTGLAFIDATFQGDHPKYGIKFYGKNMHDSFPPTIIAVVDALSSWGINNRAKQLFRYWLLNFVKNDGTIDYYGPSLSEYGQLLHIAVLLIERAGIEDWWNDCFKPLNKMAMYLLELQNEAEKEDGLIKGSPESDEKEKVGKYFHNNAWVAKGLGRWTEICKNLNSLPERTISCLVHTSEKLKKTTISAISEVWPSDPDDWWLPPQVEPLPRPKFITETREGSYTNYRYWPELLSSKILPEEMANRIVEARLHFGGQFCGMTRFEDHLDDWPLADYLYGLWYLGRKDDFLLSLYGHISYHQAEGHLTAYEQVSFPPGREIAPYCLPCQLVAARAGRLLVKG